MVVAVCDAPAVEPVLFITLVAVAIAAVLGWQVTRQQRTSRRLRDALGVRPEVDVVTALDRSLTDLAAARRDREIALATLARLMEDAGAGIITVGRDLRIVAANDAAHGLRGRATGSLVGRTVMEAFLDPGVEAAARSALAGTDSATEFRMTGTDGQTIAVRARLTPAGEAWLFLDDVSELRRLQRIRTEFIDNLSHELRTPLTTVSLLAETLSREAAAAGADIPDRMRDRIAKIEVETGHLVQMVNELLDLSRIESGGTVQLRDGVDLGRLAADAAERLRLFAERQGVDLQVKVAPDLPPIRGDAPRLGQVVVNLVHNAVKFSPDGGSVVVSTVSDGDSVVLSVSDHGIGIPPAARDRIFERFYKVDRARQRPEAGGGTGLGLAIARHVIEQHGGRVSVESSEGAGSTFRCIIPVVPRDPT